MYEAMLLTVCVSYFNVTKARNPHAFPMYVILSRNNFRVHNFSHNFITRPLKGDLFELSTTSLCSQFHVA